MITIVKEKTFCEITGRTLSCAVGKCCCGKKVELEGFTNTCDCGREYNWSGAELADRSQWGEETGESEADICGPLGQDE